MTLNVTVNLVGEGDLAAPLSLLEDSLRDGEPISTEFSERFGEAVRRGDLEVLTANDGENLVGVAVVAYRLSISAGDLFASLEEIYVRPEARRQGVGRALIQAVERRCAARKVSYVEVQVEEESAEGFYAACGYGLESQVRVMSVSYAFE